MIKLAPAAFSPYSVPLYPAFTPSTPSLQHTVDPSSPDVSTSTDMANAPSIAQALEAVRHASGLLASVPAKQIHYHHAVLAALQKLEADMTTEAPRSSFGGGSQGGAGSSASSKEKRPRDDEHEDNSLHRPPPPAPAPPSGSLDFDFHVGSRLESETSVAASTAERGEHTSGSGLTLEDRGFGDFTDLSIASLIGTESFWSWESTLPGEINAGLATLA